MNLFIAARVIVKGSLVSNVAVVLSISVIFLHSVCNSLR